MKKMFSIIKQRKEALMDIGKKIRQLRLQNDLTLEDLASRSELTKGFLSQCGDTGACKVTLQLG